MRQDDDKVEQVRFHHSNNQGKRIHAEKSPFAAVVHFPQVQLLIQVLDKLRPEEAENKIDDQAPGLNAQPDKNNPGNNAQALKYEVVSF